MHMKHLLVLCHSVAPLLVARVFVYTSSDMFPLSCACLPRARGRPHGCLLLLFHRSPGSFLCVVVQTVSQISHISHAQCHSQCTMVLHISFTAKPPWSVCTESVPGGVVKYPLLAKGYPTDSRVPPWYTMVLENPADVSVCQFFVYFAMKRFIMNWAESTNTYGNYIRC